MANKTLSDARKNKDDEFYTRLEDISEELNNYKKHFKDKVVLCNCDDPEWSNFWIFLHQNFSEFEIKKIISTHYNKDGSSSYVMEYTGGNDIDPKDWHQKSLKGNGDFASEECVELLKEADLIVTNPPFSIAREKFIPLLFEHNKKFIIIGDLNWISYKNVFPLFKDNKMWLGYNYVKSFVRPNGELQKFGNKLWFTNLDIPKRHIKLIPTLKKSFSNHPELYQKYDNYDAINVDKVKDIPDDYFEALGVPITFFDKYNPDEFELLDGRNFTNVERLKNKDTYLLKDADGSVDGKNKYARIIIRRKMKRGEREAKTILEQQGLSFNPCYYDDGENDNNPDFQYSDGRFLEITHTEHYHGGTDKLNKYSLYPVEKRLEINAKAFEAYERYFSCNYPRDENGIITEEGKKIREKDRKTANEHFGIDAEYLEKGNVRSRCFDYENIFDVIDKKHNKHSDKDLDLFIFVHKREIELFIHHLKKDKTLIMNRMKEACFKKIFICSFDFDGNKYDTNNYILIEVDNINNTLEIIYEGLANEN